MRVLFTILLVAFAGLLWATVAAARHIRQTRFRQREKAAISEVERLEVDAASIPQQPPAAKSPSAVLTQENASHRLMRPKPLQSYF